ncbi:MAG: protein-L-isoaspartate(D-aspartate) O-methyltransferase [Myxococcota bacterium]
MKRDVCADRDRWVVSRRRMVERLARSGIRDRRVLDALGAVPRHLLVPDALGHRAYEEAPLPIGSGQTISAPGTVAAMSAVLALEGHEQVLEIGTGSAYQAAVLSQLAERVVSVERVPALASRARRALDRLGVTNVVVHLGDGTRGWPADAPYDAIVVTAGGPEIPAPLLEQLAPGGRLIGPFGARGAQRLMRVRREPQGRLRSPEVLGEAKFVDLVGDHGWGG